VLSVTGFARAVSRALRQRPELLAAVRGTPWAVDDERGENATVIREIGAYAKTGAEGVMLIALESGETVVVKTLDGAERVGTPVALELLARLGLVTRDSVARIHSLVGNPALRVAF
jgi:L-asparaginase II